MCERITVFDTTLRDGEQAPGCSMFTEEKLRMARQLVELGVDILEAGFPIASDGDFEAVAAICRELPDARVAALARACPRDIERAARALEASRRPRIHTFIATSDIHLVYKLRKTREQALAEAAAAVEQAHRYADDVEFSAEDAARSDPDFLEQVCRTVVAAGATTVNLPDTVGHCLPEEYAALIGRMVRAIDGQATVSVHCHNDLGLAVANSLAAVRAGARQVECTVNGIGERAGNCSLEEVVMILKARQDTLPFDTGVVTRQLYPSSRLLTELITFGPQPNKAIVGANAFAHEAGIHQDGLFKERTTYEIIDPAEVGVPESRIVLGKHSGRHSLDRRCEDLGFDLTHDQLDVVYRAFTQAADRKKGLTDDEIAQLVRNVLFGRWKYAPAPEAAEPDDWTLAPSFYL
ncbi:MAG TPA: 2-isopropylmalate synthase [Acidobacteriota bacterium]|nr:2-isopropylmalate synthase [Acidobacteriota bacterium]